MRIVQLCNLQIILGDKRHYVYGTPESEGLNEDQFSLFKFTPHLPYCIAVHSCSYRQSVERSLPHKLKVTFIL